MNPLTHLERFASGAIAMGLFAGFLFSVSNHLWVVVTVFYLLIVFVATYIVGWLIEQYRGMDT